MTVRLKQAFFLAMCCLTAVANPLFAQGKKGGGGGGGTPPPALPNVRYHVDVIPTPVSSVWVNQINNAGVVVGHMSNRAFLYDHSANRLYDLNTDDDLQPVRDQLADPDLFGPEWFFNSAIGVNDHGQVVGRVENAITGVKKGFAFDTFELSAPEFWTLLRLPAIASDDSYGRRVSLTGDVLGIYRRADGSGDCFLCNPWTGGTAETFGIDLFQSNADMNNLGQVAGVLSNGTPFFDGNEISSLSGCLRLGGVNRFGVLCLNGREKTGKRLNQLGPLTAFRYDSVANQQEAILQGGWPVGINSEGDVAIESAPSSLAYNGSTNVPKQVLKVTDLVPDSDPWKSMLVNNSWTVQALNDRDATGFSQLTGRISTTEGFIGVVLTPYTP